MAPGLFPSDRRHDRAGKLQPVQTKMQLPTLLSFGEYSNRFLVKIQAVNLKNMASHNAATAQQKVFDKAFVGGIV